MKIEQRAGLGRGARSLRPFAGNAAETARRETRAPGRDHERTVEYAPYVLRSPAGGEAALHGVADDDVERTASGDDTRWRFDDIADGEEEEAVPRASLLMDMHGAFAHALWRAHDEAAAAPSNAEDVVMRARRG